MMPETTPERSIAGEPTMPRPRLAYARPRLKVLGNLADLTRGSLSTMMDADSSMTLEGKTFYSLSSDSADPPDWKR